jgi:hypothetical protein
MILGYLVSAVAESPGSNAGGMVSLHALLKPQGPVTVLVGSNQPTPHRVMSQDIEDTANLR